MKKLLSAKIIRSLTVLFQTAVVSSLGFASANSLAEVEVYETTTRTTISEGDVIKMPVGSQTDSSHLPKRGTLKADVESQYGAPRATHGPVGEPPITRWEYSDFEVVFEYNHVIHAVSKK